MQSTYLDFERPLEELDRRIEELSGGRPRAPELDELLRGRVRLETELYRDLGPWVRVQLSRHPDRPQALDYATRVFRDFTELHGDRCFADDAAVIGGIAWIGEQPVLLVGHQRGRTTQEKVRRNFGMPKPEGYRKALRLFRLAERFGRPIVCLIDTQGAFPGPDAEERGQAEAIARNLRAMAALRVPIVVCVIGEGGSGGALALGVGDRVLMFEYACYSVITPEGCASILYREKTAGSVARAAEALRLTARDLLALEVIDEVLPEPAGAAHRHPAQAMDALRGALARHLTELGALSGDELRRARYEKFRRMGRF
ncbi:MAG: acetyl-CoA carboxylase carboxyltransferase subunit alpha [Deltaproteobacteria bacterium]|nr:acetyl-CoA carboxylase carboxyltransferase subunit alpha [Deltaproteobacteria bacterium]